MSYTPLYGPDIASVIDKTTQAIRDQGISKNLHVTRTLCYLYLLSMGELVKGALSCLGSDSVLCHRILERSLFDYLLDLLLIAKRDDEDLNKQFAHYHDATLGYMGHIINLHRDMIGPMKARSAEAIYSYYPHLLPEYARDSTAIDDGAVEKAAKALISKAWTRFSFVDKLKTVMIEHAIGVLDGHTKAISTWDKKVAHLKKSIQNWEDLSFETQADLVLKAIQEGAGLDPIGLASLDPSFRRAFSNFKFGSEFTHPTPRAVVPHLKIQTGEFELTYRFSDSTFRLAELQCWLIYSSAVSGANAHLDDIGDDSLSRFYESECVRTLNLGNWIRKKAEERIDATSSRDE